MARSNCRYCRGQHSEGECDLSWEGVECPHCHHLTGALYDVETKRGYCIRCAQYFDFPAARITVLRKG